MFEQCSATGVLHQQCQDLVNRLAPAYLKNIKLQRLIASVRLKYEAVSTAECA